MQTGSTCSYTVILVIQFIYFLGPVKDIGGRKFCDVLKQVENSCKNKGEEGGGGGVKGYSNLGIGDQNLEGRGSHLPLHTHQQTDTQGLHGRYRGQLSDMEVQGQQLTWGHRGNY